MSQGQTTTYQMVTLTPGLSDKILADESPDVLQGELWQFLNTDISTANLTDIDFLNIMSMVDIAFCDLLTGIPEDKWQEFKIRETTWDTDPHTRRLVPVNVKEFPITTLWNAVRAKIYIKCCKSRGGFLMNVLTENRSRILQEYEERGTVPPGVPGIQGQPEKKRWGPLGGR